MNIYYTDNKTEVKSGEVLLPLLSQYN
jgi:hypothetical protein